MKSLLDLSCKQIVFLEHGDKLTGLLQVRPGPRQTAVTLHTAPGHGDVVRTGVEQYRAGSTAAVYPARTGAASRGRQETSRANMLQLLLCRHSRRR